MSYTLVIAEKPSVAQALAKVLHATNRKDGYLEGNGYLVSWCVGHLVELAPADAYDEKYGKWNQADLPILPGHWKYQVSASKRKQFKIVKDLMHRDDITVVVNAADAGREGESIFRNVYYQAKCSKPIKRLWISSMEDKAISDGFHNLVDGSEYENLFASAQARAQADWLVGINGTRLFTTLYGSLIRVGRVQSPVLTMICERAEKIGSFVKQPYWNLYLNCGDVTFTKEKIMDKEEAYKATLKTNEASKEDSDEPKEGTALLPPLSEGHTYSSNVAKLTDHFTTPPKHYTEDSILAAMETAGNDQFMEDTEKKGLGTPATRAGILEKLVKSNYVKRKGKSLIPTPEGIAVVKVLPDTLKSPSLTAEWENTLMEIEKGICSPDEFMRGIQGMVTGLVKSYDKADPDLKSLFPRKAYKKKK